VDAGEGVWQPAGMEWLLRGDGQWVFVAIVGLLVLGPMARPLLAWWHRRRNPRSYRRVAAQVVDVTVKDVRSGDSTTTAYRVVLRFTPEHGEMTVVDMTLRPTPEQKDLLLPDHWVMIEYRVDDPQTFNVDYVEGEVNGPEGARVEADTPTAKVVYGPPR
jgi:hypothetical protein